MNQKELGTVILAVMIVGTVVCIALAILTAFLTGGLHPLPGKIA